MFRIETEKDLLQAFRPRDRKTLELPADLKFPLFVRDYLAWSEPAGTRVFLVLPSQGSRLPVGIAFRRDSATSQMTLTPGVPGAVNNLSKVDLDELEQQINRLSESIEQKKGEWNPELRAAYERNLIYVNQSLAECRHQVNDNPADDTAQELMLNAYREKVRLLEGFGSF